MVLRDEVEKGVKMGANYSSIQRTNRGNSGNSGKKKKHYLCGDGSPSVDKYVHGTMEDVFREDFALGKR